MSVYNYYVIGKSIPTPSWDGFNDDKKFVVAMGWASSEYPADLEFWDNPRFETLKEAVEYCESEGSEYGYHLDPSVWSSDEH